MFTFRKVTLADKDMIFSWLDEPHMQEFWDNSQGHRDDIVNFMHGRKTRSEYFGGSNTYWLGLKDDVPFAFIMTHEENETTDPPGYYQPYLSKTGKTFGIDFGIGNTKYFGKGLAAPTLEAFTAFFAKEIEPQTDVFLIDPSLGNPRAIHVYAKAGFEKVAEFTQEGGYFDAEKGVLMVKAVGFGDGRLGGC